MVKVDYEKVGFKAGLEIHQQLDTDKLFCNCPSVLRSNEPEFVVQRKLHAVAGESGEIDEAAAYEKTLNKEFFYQGYDTTCLVELDEEPPREINKDSLKVALQISLLMNCKIVPLSQIMRKTIINGSNTSGFQRTVMIARDGFLETSKGRVGIETVLLEEDSARPVEKEEGKTVFRVDRLGIPLVEIATSPDIKDAEHAKETALKIGEILRSCNVKRGIGTIRQDINISVKGSNRVELKGFQDPKIMTKTVDNEVNRQLSFLKENKKNPKEVRKVLPDGESEFLRPMPGSARMYPETDLPLLKISKTFIDETKRNLPRLRSEVESELRKKGLNEEMITLLLKQNKVEEFKDLLSVLNDPSLVAKVLLIFTKEIASKEKISVEEINEVLSRDVLHFILENYRERKISERQVKEAMERVVKGEKVEKAVKFEKEDLGNVEEKIMKIIKEKPGLNPNAYMGLVMKELKGKIDGKEAMKIIKKFLE